LAEYNPRVLTLWPGSRFNHRHFGALVSAGSQCRILVVDDESFVRDAVRMMLAFDGHLVQTAANGQEALALFEKGKFDVVITDFAMPSMRGDALAAAIKARDPKQPVVMITAYAEMLGPPEHLPEGVDYLLSKPFLLEDLRLAVSTVASSTQKG
jgi:two-component system response regulator AtoC